MSSQLHGMQITQQVRYCAPQLVGSAWCVKQQISHAQGLRNCLETSVGVSEQLAMFQGHARMQQHARQAHLDSHMKFQDVQRLLGYVALSWITK